jgi:hypothetical protein
MNKSAIVDQQLQAVVIAWQFDVIIAKVGCYFDQLVLLEFSDMCKKC